MNEHATPPSDESQQRALDQALTQLPSEIAPPVEAWHAVRSRLTPRAATSTATTAARPERSAARRAIKLTRTLTRRIATLAAAAVVLITAGVLLLQPPAEDPAQPTFATAALSSGGPSLAALTAELEARRDVLSPATIALVEQNLLTINRAIDETARALADDPGNVQLELMLAQVTRRREQFVREARSMVADL